MGLTILCSTEGRARSVLRDVQSTADKEMRGTSCTSSDSRAGEQQQNVEAIVPTVVESPAKHGSSHDRPSRRRVLRTRRRRSQSEERARRVRLQPLGHDVIVSTNASKSLPGSGGSENEARYKKQ